MGGMDTNLERTGSATSLRVAYADPPYIGQARKHYSHDPRCAEVDHAKLKRSDDGWYKLESPNAGGQP